MATIAEELQLKGVSDSQIVYLDLDRRPYRSVKTPDSLEKLIDNNTHNSGITYIFIDEIQNVKGFEMRNTIAFSCRESVCSHTNRL